jgi:hypothetical protein
MRALAIMLAIAGCTPRQTRIAHVVTGAIAAGAYACDWRQTRANASGGWSAHVETNPMLGTRPSEARVDFYFAAVAATVLLAELLPERWRPAVYAPIAALELETVSGNLNDHNRSCL